MSTLSHPQTPSKQLLNSNIEIEHTKALHVPQAPRKALTGNLLYCAQINCPDYATWGMEGYRPSHCDLHRTPNMIKSIEFCCQCSRVAEFDYIDRKYCKEHIKAVNLTPRLLNFDSLTLN